MLVRLLNHQVSADLNRTHCKWLLTLLLEVRTDFLLHDIFLYCLHVEAGKGRPRDAAQFTSLATLVQLHLFPQFAARFLLLLSETNFGKRARRLHCLAGDRLTGLFRRCSGHREQV